MVRLVVASNDPQTRITLLRLFGPPGFAIVGDAEDGASVGELARRLKPDAIVVDVNLRGEDGIEIAEQIMHEDARPIIVVAEQPTERLRDRAVHAGALALERIPHPAHLRYESEAGALRDLVAAMAEVRLVKRRRARARPPAQARVEVIGMAASTGGPAALASILAGLPSDAPVPILIVQHIVSGFEPGLVRWLDRVSGPRVFLAEEGRPLRAGEVLIGPDGVHLGVGPRGCVAFSDEPPIDGHRPSATYLFRSLAGTYRAGALGVMLTGMGQDGLEGLRAVRAGGGKVIAQDESSSIVFGMPARVIETGLAHEVVALEDLPATLMAAWRAEPRTGRDPR